MSAPLYIEPHQARTRPPTIWENELADVIEEAFAGGAWELPALVARLNESRVRTPDGARWTETSFVAIVGKLAE